jgi:glycosyltransferase involved in cell wall biosynthesis
MPSTTQKRVLIATPVLLLGGTEIQMLTLVRILVKEGYHVALCCYYEFDQTVVDQFKGAGVEVFLLKLDRSNGYFGIKGIWELMKKLIHVFEVYNPNIIHVQYLAPGLIPIIAARLSGIPAIFATVHIAGSIAYGLKAKLLLRIAAKLTTAFVCVSQGVEQFWFGDSYLFRPEKPDDQRKHFTIYNGIDVSKIIGITGGVDRNELRNSLGIKDQPVAGIVGRLARQKGHTVLLDAFADVIKKFQNTILFIIGDGPDKAQLQERAKRLGLDGYIRWFGALPQEEVFRLYTAMDVFVMPSLYEGFGLTAVEAMAANLPVVGTRVDGLSEIIEDGVTGYLLQVGDSQGLADVLVDLLSNAGKRKRMGERGRERVQQLFGAQHFVRSFISVYENFS